MLDLPKYKITIDPEYSEGEDLGIEQIAFTSMPAIKTKGMAFNEELPIKEKLYFADKIKCRIVAPAMIPMTIYRCNDNEEYYVEFTESEIEKINAKFMKNFTNRKVFNLEHNKDVPVPAYILESWIVDNPEMDKSFSTYGIKVPKGTLMITSQVTDKETYNQLVENEQTGYSIEGFLGLSLSELINKKNKEQKMKKELKKFKFAEYTLADGSKIKVDGDLAVGSPIYKVMEDGSWEQCDQGEYTLEDGTTLYVDEAGLINEVRSKETSKIAEENKMEEIVVEAAAEVAPVTPEVAPVSNGYSKEEIDAKFDELYQMIADLQVEEQMQEPVAVEMSEQTPKELSIHQRFAVVMDAINKNV